MSKQPRRRPGLDRWIKNSSTPLFAVDRRRRLVYFNHGCEILTGWPADEITGRQCQYSSDITDHSAQAVADCLCPPPDVFNGHSLRVPIYVHRKSGESVPRQILYQPLVQSEQDVQVVLGIVEPMDKPVSAAAVTATHRLHAELAALRVALRQRYQLSQLIAHSDVMRRVCDQIVCARDASCAVHLVGPAGAGKQHIARLIHYQSEQQSSAFVPLDCARLRPLEIRQALRRAFEPDPTAAESVQAGAIYLANVDQLPRDLQTQLVNLLDHSSSVRMYSACLDRDLKRLTEEDLFHSQLMYRLTTLEIAVPALRERRSDIQPLAQHFLELNNRGQDKQLAGFSDACWSVFSEYGWPGNVAELKAVVDESWEACPGDQVAPEHLPFRFRAGLDAQAIPPTRSAQPVDLDQVLRATETELIQQALNAADNNRSAAAQLLGLTRARLYRRMESLGIDAGSDP